MGLAAFRRAREREAAELVASIPVKAPELKRKRKKKPKPKTYGNLDSGDSRISHSQQLHNSL